MKYPEHRMSLEAAMPLSDSILSWLGHQLELRGIDSVIYTRYIISLLQQDVADIDSADREGFWDRKADAKKCKDKKDGKKKLVSEEERRKNAAVECLLSVSDGDHDIESLVEELCIRLKETKSSQGYFTPLSIHTKDEAKFQTEVQDPAERYYAAFPALPGDGTPPQASPSSDDNIWRRNRKSGSLAGETSGNKEGSPQNLSPELKEDSSTATEVKATFEKKSATESKSSSNSPAGTEKRKKPGKGESSQKLTPNGSGKKKTACLKGKKEVKGHSKAVRFLSWPPPGHGRRQKGSYSAEKGEGNNSEETEEEKYCSMVEQMLKEMLLSDKKLGQATVHLPVLAYFPEEGFPENCFTEWFREDSQSPEFTENDDWYTQPLEHIFYTPVSQTKRLYKRHSYPPSMLTFEEDLEWSSLVTEQLLCLKRASQEYILVGDVFDPAKPNLDANPEESRDDLLESCNEDVPTGNESEKDVIKETGEDPEDLDSKSVENTPKERSLVDEKEENEKDDEASEKEVMPLWFDDIVDLDSDPFTFDQPNFADFPTYRVTGTPANNPKPSALSLALPCPFPDVDPECLVPVTSDTSSPVSSVERGYFSDVTETSYVFDVSRHSSPFPDMLLLMNYGEEEETGEIPGTASSLKGSRLESLFEASRMPQNETLAKSEVFEVQRTPQSEVKPEFDFCADDLFPYIPEEENGISYGTRNMFPNGATFSGNPLGELVFTETGVEAETDVENKPGSITSSHHESELKLFDSSSEERDESACFPSDLFNSFSSVGESSGGSVFTESAALVDHNYVLDLLDTRDDLQNECPTSLLFHLSPMAGSEGSCWQNKILLHDYGESLSFGNLGQSAGLAWDSVLNQRKKYIWASVVTGSPAVELSVGSPTLQGELWQLWDVNGQKKLPDLWQRATDSNIWNSILNLSVYTPGRPDDQTGWTNDEDVLFSDIINEEDAVLGLQFLEEINGYGCKGPRYERSVSESDLNSMSNNLFVDVSKPNLDISYELIPSENSAFQGVVPKQLHHVRSAPNLRYKSLVSMHPETDLQPIGLISTESPVEHLYFSAKTHFRPIQTPVATPDEDSDGQAQDLFGGMSDNSGTPYQHFVNPGEEESKFRPKFKIQKDLDKYIQTGGSLDEADADYERFKQYQLEQAKDIQTEFIEEVVGSVLEDAAEIFIQEQNWNSEPIGESEVESARCSEICKNSDDTIVKEEEQSVLVLCENMTVLCTKSDGEEDSEETEQIQEVESVTVLDDPKWDGQKIKEMHFSDQMKNYHDIWSSGYDMDLHPFSVENECLFLPCSVGERLCNSEVAIEDEESKDEEKCGHSDELYFYYLDSYPEVDSYILSTCSEDCSGEQNYEVSSLIPIPHQAVYSSDLEKQWLDRRAHSAGKNSKKKSHKFKLRRDSSKRKPCSFFLEGNCRRSDCKFSHDLSSITCRFWEDGLCFKGTLCPFFHGYTSDTEPGGSHSGKAGDRYEYRKDDFPELDSFGKKMHKDSHSQKISWKRQAHKEFLKKTLSSRRKNRPSTKQPARTMKSSSC